MAFLPRAVVAGEPCCHGGPKIAKIAPLPQKSGEYRLKSQWIDVRFYP
jgi:hypothetical protein